MSFFLDILVHAVLRVIQFSKNCSLKFPGHPVVGALRFRFRGTGSTSGGWIKIWPAPGLGQKSQIKKECSDYSRIQFLAVSLTWLSSLSLNSFHNFIAREKRTALFIGTASVKHCQRQHFCNVLTAAPNRLKLRFIPHQDYWHFHNFAWIFFSLPRTSSEWWCVFCFHIWKWDFHEEFTNSKPGAGEVKLGRIPSSLPRSLLALSRVWQWLCPHRPLVAGPTAGPSGPGISCVLVTDSSFSQNMAFTPWGDLSRIYYLLCARGNIYIFFSCVFW